MSMNAKNLAETMDQDEREIMDSDSWDWDNVTEGSTVGTPGAILRVRFSREEFRAIERMARDAGIGPVELLRRTMLDRIAPEVSR